MHRKLRWEIREEKSIERVLREDLGFTRRQVSALKFREKGITVNGVRQRVNYRLQPGERLEIEVEPEGQSSDQIVPLHESLQILYEDEDVLVVNKPAGILTHPAGGHYGDTLTNQLAAYFKEKGETAVLRPVGRLDKDTSGAVLFAKSKIAAARLSREKGTGGFEKEYLAIVCGIPEEKTGRIEAPIGPAPVCRSGSGTEAHGEPLRMQVDFKNGKSAETFYRVEAAFRDCALVRVWIATGRTHQIRVHMAFIGHPLLGDLLYGGTGNEESAFARAALHASVLRFPQPFTGRLVEVHAPLPEDFETFAGSRSKI